MSVRTLKTRLREAGLYRRKNYSPLAQVRRAILTELRGPGQMFGYRHILPDKVRQLLDNGNPDVVKGGQHVNYHLICMPCIKIMPNNFFCSSHLQIHLTVDHRCGRGLPHLLNRLTCFRPISNDPCHSRYLPFPLEVNVVVFC